MVKGVLSSWQDVNIVVSLKGHLLKILMILMLYYILSGLKKLLMTPNYSMQKVIVLFCLQLYMIWSYNAGSSHNIIVLFCLQHDLDKGFSWYTSSGK